MNRIEQMIHALCPQGVKRVRLGECCAFRRGSTITAKDAIAGDIPVIAGGQKPAYYHNVSNRSGESVTIAGSGAYAGFVAYWNQPIYVSDAFTIEFKQGLGLPKYLYYFLKNIQEKIHNTKKGSGVPHVHPSSIDTIEIPLPPLSIQGEIVKFLDRFAVLTAELEAELEARRKQYEYYRTRLLSFDSDSRSDTVQWKALGEVGTFIRGRRFVRTDIVEEGQPCIHYGDMYTYYGLEASETRTHLPEDFAVKLRYAEKGDVVIVAAGENDWDIGVGLAWMGERPVAIHDACFIFKSNMNPKYVAHYLRTEKYHQEIRKYVSTAKICAISSEGLSKAMFPVRSLEEQERIVGILDKFDQLVNGVKDSLPELIDKVQKQYEFYRNKLLTFPEA